MTHYRFQVLSSRTCVTKFAYERNFDRDVQSRQMLQEMGREPTPEELGIRVEIPEAKVRHIMRVAAQPISMETPVGEDGDAQLGDSKRYIHRLDG